MRKEIEMMRVLRVPPLGKLVVQVGGERYEDWSQVSHPQVKQRLLAAIGELIVFAGGYQKLIDAGVAPQFAHSAPGTDADTADDELTEQRRNRFLAQMESERDNLRAQTKDVPEVKVEALVDDAPASPRPASGLSLVEQIDALLQKHVAANADLADRSIHLKQNPAGGLHIEVDGNTYERPREIEDVKIQRVIKAALKEWENS